MDRQDTSDRVALLRRRMTAMVDAAGGSAVPSADALPAPEGMRALFSRGVIDRGSVVSVVGAGSVLLSMIATASAADAHVAVVGMPALSVLGLVEMGGVVERLSVIPDPGSDPIRIAAVLLDGIDVVVLNLGGADVPPSRARAVTARVRAKSAVLLVVDGTWPGVDLRLASRITGYDGLGVGHGRLRSLQVEVSADGRAGRTRRARVCLESVDGVARWRTAAGSGGEGAVPIEGVS